MIRGYCKDLLLCGVLLFALVSCVGSPRVITFNGDGENPADAIAALDLHGDTLPGTDSEQDNDVEADLDGGCPVGDCTVQWAKVQLTFNDGQTDFALSDCEDCAVNFHNDETVVFRYRQSNRKFVWFIHIATDSVPGKYELKGVPDERFSFTMTIYDIPLMPTQLQGEYDFFGGTVTLLSLDPSRPGFASGTFDVNLRNRADSSIKLNFRGTFYAPIPK